MIQDKKFLQEMLMHMGIKHNNIVPVFYNIEQLSRDIKRGGIMFFGQLTSNIAFTKLYVLPGGIVPNSCHTLLRGQYQYCLWSAGTNIHEIVKVDNLLFDDIHLNAQGMAEDYVASGANSNVTTGTPAPGGATSGWSITISNNAGTGHIRFRCMFFTGYKISY